MKLFYVLIGCWITVLMYPKAFCDNATTNGAVYNIKPKITDGLNFEQKLGSHLPLDLDVMDDDGSQVPLRTFFMQNQEPVIFGLGYYECPGICTAVFREAFHTLEAAHIKNKSYKLIFLSIHPGETSKLAFLKKRAYIKSFPHAALPDHIHFLTATEKNIKKISDAVGFSYRWDENSKQYVHPSGLVILTSQGIVSHYLYGIRYNPMDMKLSLSEASEGKVGGIVEKILLFCYKYDPKSGKYGFVIMKTLKMASLFTVFILSGFILLMFQREKNNQHRRKRA